MQIQFAKNNIRGILPKGVTLAGDTITFPLDEKLIDFSGQDETHFYRMPDGSCLVHVFPGTRESEVYLNPHQFEIVKASLQ